MEIQPCIACCFVESNYVLVADGDATSAVSPTRRVGAPRKYVWNAQSPTKRLLYADSGSVHESQW